jgi:hypothetical protein
VLLLEAHHIALKIGCIIVGVPTVDQGKGIPIGIVDKGSSAVVTVKRQLFNY